MAISEWALVALGGAGGSLLRYSLHHMIRQSRFTGPAFWPAGLPLSTLCANLLGCLLAGGVLAVTLKSELLSPALKALLLTGFLGGLTTFSAFSLETLQLWLAQQHALAALNLGLNLGGSLLAVMLGYGLFSR
ncbi:MAG: fluoride efflux transporter CrcB [Candidatus Sericytochromatia bacterium]